MISNRDWDEAPAEIAAQSGLSEGQVKEALAFYEAHQTEIDLLIESDSALEMTRDE